MNKKLLGIAAVALLGVSAAFAATTSTVYFTASGTLTKVSTPSFGVYSTYIADSGSTIPSYVYNGEETLVSNIKATPSDDGKVENTKLVTGCTDNDYLYTKYTLSGLNFSKAKDYLLFGINLVNNESKSYSFTYNKAVAYTQNGTNETIGGYTSCSVTGTNADKFSVKLGTCIELMLDDEFTSSYYYIKGDSSTKYTFEKTQTFDDNSKQYCISAKAADQLYVLIQLNKDITSETAGDFSLNITLPTFEQAE